MIIARLLFIVPVLVPVIRYVLSYHYNHTDVECLSKLPSFRTTRRVNSCGIPDG